MLILVFSAHLEISILAAGVLLLLVRFTTTIPAVLIGSIFIRRYLALN